MYSNIITKKVTDSSLRSLIRHFSPTEVTFSPVHSGKSIGFKKYLKLLSINPDGGESIKIIAGEEEIIVDEKLMGFSVNDSLAYSDYIYVDDDNSKVTHFKCVDKINLRDYLSSISVNRIYDTHSTFQLKLSMGDMKKKYGISNIYSDMMKTHLISSASITETGIVGAEGTVYVFIKIAADDEKFYCNGERIIDVEVFKQWISENGFNIWFEMDNPVVTDITDSDIGKILLGLQPEKDYLWSVNGANSELCVYTDIDYKLTKIESMIIEE